MNKILKIIIKQNPIFKYIVEDYPFYEGIFFHSKDFHNMNILNTHYLLRSHLSINKGNTEFFCNPEYLLHLNLSIQSPSPKFLINPKSKVKTKAKFHVTNDNKVYIRLNQRIKMNNKSSFKVTINPHLIKLIRLKTHDRFILENRDMLTFSNMDGEKFIRR